MEQQPQKGISKSLSGVTSGIKRLGLLYLEKARLKTTEKLTILLSTVAFTAVVVALSLILLVFVSIGVGHWLATSIAPHLAYLFVAAFYLLLLIAVAALRKQLFITPIARFMSRLIVKEPEFEPETDDKDEPEDKSVKATATSDGMPEIDYDRLADTIIKNLEKKNRDESETTDTEMPDEEGGRES